MDRLDFEERYGADYAIGGTGKVRDPYKLMGRVLRGLDFPEEQIRRAADARMGRVRRTLYGVEPKNLALLRRLRDGGIKTALVSNADIMDIIHWPGSPLSSAFDTVVFSCEAALLKPDPRIYRLAVDQLCLDPGQCLFVGDGGHDELKGAKAAGLTAVLTTEYISLVWPERIPALREDADHVVSSLEEIPGLIPGF
jgi:putative hydrolase of the HAD superfamily